MTGPQLVLDDDAIGIKPLAKTNRLVLAITAVALAGLSFIGWLLLPSSLLLVAALCGVFSIILGLITLSKYSMPAYSFILHRQRLSHYQSKGSWTLNWPCIQRVDQPRVTMGLEVSTLPYVAIRLTDDGYERLLSSLSPRLANHLLVNQRALLLQGDGGCNTGNCYAEGLIEKDKFVTPKGTRHTGPIAMFGNRMQRLRANLGYDLYIDTDYLDRSPENFITLLKQCQQTAVSQMS